MMEGYVKLSREIRDWEYFKDGNCMKVLIYLLVHAKYKPETYGGYNFEVGDVRFTYPELEKACGITYNQARDAIRKIKTTGILTVKSTPKFSVGSLKKWAFQQSTSWESTAKSTVKSTPSYNKEINKEKRIDFGKGGIRFPYERT